MSIPSISKHANEKEKGSLGGALQGCVTFARPDHVVNTIRTGQVVMPSDDEEILGGHSIIIVGFDDNKKNYIFLNSWGKLWGNNGIGYIPYDYILNEDLSDEFFILTKVTNPIIDFFDGGHITNNKISPNIKTNNMNNSSQIIKILLLSILIIIHSL